MNTSPSLLALLFLAVGPVACTSSTTTAPGETRTTSEAVQEGPGAPPPPPGRPHTKLNAVTHTGTIATVLVNPHGDADGALLDDGAVVRMPPMTRDALAKGKRVSVTGNGTATFIHADTLTVDGATTPLRLAPPPPPSATPVALPALDDNGTIARIVPDPEGRPDVLILSDAAIVRVPPPVRDAAIDLLKVGAVVAVHGEGGVYDGVKALHADRIEIAGQTFSEPARPARPPAPPAP